MTVDEFMASDEATEGHFQSLLFAHVIEHLEPDGARAILTTYLPYARPGGSVMFVVPRSVATPPTPTHVWFARFEELNALALMSVWSRASWSFPFRSLGKAFIYSEFCVLAKIPG